ncbi:MAG: hypothetical protein M0R06_09885 [Sphaerochaeta sp.]|jgi:hypothetical protein|nr:hypothetical protein [Sphaerochaeta sp.]
MPSFDDLNPISDEPSGNGLVGQGFEKKESYTQEVAVTDSAQSETDSNQPEQRSSGEKGDSTDFEVDDFRAGKDAFRAWRHGARVANGKGFFCAPPPDSKPAKNSDYLRMWVDELVSGGYGVIGLPMSDELWFNATGDAEYVTLAAETTTGSDVVTFTSTAGLEVGMNIREYLGSAAIDPPTHLARGTYVKAILSTTTVQVTKDAIGTGTGLNMRVGLNANALLQLHGPQVVGSDNSGIVDLYGVLDLLQGGDSVETSGLYDDKGAVYFNTVSNKVRWYNGTVWGDLGGGTVRRFVTTYTFEGTASYVTFSEDNGAGGVNAGLVPVINDPTLTGYSIASIGETNADASKPLKRNPLISGILRNMNKNGNTDAAQVFYFGIGLVEEGSTPGVPDFENYPHIGFKGVLNLVSGNYDIYTTQSDGAAETATLIGELESGINLNTQEAEMAFEVTTDTSVEYSLSVSGGTLIQQTETTNLPDSDDFHVLCFAVFSTASTTASGGFNGDLGTLTYSR